MLAKLAKKGHIVGRVKGEDPFIFGRGGEEILRLFRRWYRVWSNTRNNFSHSCSNYAGIPVTHRAISQGFHVFTGMTAEKLNIDWKAVICQRRWNLNIFNGIQKFRYNSQ